MAYLNKHKIIYLERPVTNDEKALALLLETLIDTLYNNNFEKFKSAFSPDASIFLSSTGKNPVGVTECIKRLEKFTGNIRNLGYKNVSIRVNDSQAIISALRTVSLKGEMPRQAMRYFKCKKENNKWIIIEADFV